MGIFDMFKKEKPFDGARRDETVKFIQEQKIRLAKEEPELLDKTRELIEKVNTYAFLELEKDKKINSDLLYRVSMYAYEETKKAGVKGRWRSMVYHTMLLEFCAGEAHSKGDIMLFQLLLMCSVNTYAGLENVVDTVNNKLQVGINNLNEMELYDDKIDELDTELK